MYINEDSVRKYSFPEFIKWARQSITHLNHRDKSDNAYDEAISFCRVLCEQMVGRYRIGWDDYKTNAKTASFFKIEEDLHYYKMNMSDKRKREIISSFKRSMEIELLLVNIKDMPDPTIEN